MRPTLPCSPWMGKRSIPDPEKDSRRRVARLISSSPQHPAHREHVTTSPFDLRDAVLTPIRTKELDARRGKNRLGTDELTPRLRRLEDHVEPIMPASLDRIRMRRNARAFRISDQVAVKRHRPGRCQQEHLVITGTLSARLPTKRLLSVSTQLREKIHRSPQNAEEEDAHGALHRHPARRKNPPESPHRA